MTLEEWRDKHRDIALKQYKRLEKARARLRKFSLFSRIIFFWKFSRIRAKIVNYRDAVTYNTTVMLSIQRKIKWKRRQDKLKNG